ncbi:GSCOCG00004563001-RA-CDS, partial [Cotesia congregata]
MLATRTSTAIFSMGTPKSLPLTISQSWQLSPESGPQKSSTADHFCHCLHDDAPPVVLRLKPEAQTTEHCCLYSYQRNLILLPAL